MLRRVKSLKSVRSMFYFSFDTNEDPNQHDMTRLKKWWTRRAIYTRAKQNLPLRCRVRQEQAPDKTYKVENRSTLLTIYAEPRTSNNDMVDLLLVTAIKAHKAKVCSGNSPRPPSATPTRILYHTVLNLFVWDRSFRGDVIRLNQRLR